MPMYITRCKEYYYRALYNNVKQQRHNINTKNNFRQSYIERKF